MQTERLNILGAVLLGFSKKQSGGRAVFASPMASELSETLAWGDIPEFMTGAALEGSLHLSSCELTPKDKLLRTHAITLDAGQMTEFKTVRRELKGTKGKGHRVELRFMVLFSDPAGCAKLEAYMQGVGSEKSAIRISFTKEPVQQELVEAEPAENKQAAIAGVQ